ncbi:31709_t:CDS:1, partial [Gigaspora margarita]
EKLLIEKNKLQLEKEKIEKEEINNKKNQQYNIFLELVQQGKSLTDIKEILDFFNNL